MDLEQISNLLSIPTSVTERKVDEAAGLALYTLNRKLHELDLITFDFGAGKHKELVMPKFEYDLTGTTAGQAWGKDKIRLNLKALQSDNPQIVEHMYKVTIPHEICHSVEYQLYGRMGHGNGWKFLMNLLGLPANRTHALPLEKARVHKKPYVYRCACRTINLSKTRHDRAQRGRAYICTLCNQQLWFTGEVIDG